MTKFGRFAALASISVVGVLATGCSSFKFEGRVIQGDVSYATIVSADDPQLTTGTGVGGTRVRVVTDPDRPNRREVGSGVTGPDGSFSLEIDAFGAGVLEYDIGVDATRPGFAGVDEFFRMPRRGEKVLIVLAPGRDNRRPRESLMEQYDRFR